MKTQKQIEKNERPSKARSEANEAQEDLWG